MPIQFARSSSTGDRRRRRLAVNGDDFNLDPASLNDTGAEIESQLVASAAAAPWVPVSEFRIWVYAALIGVLLTGLSVALARPVPFRPAVKPFADQLLSDQRPLLVILIEVGFLALSTQLGILITWYRSRCQLDFGGRYRVWPWASGLFGLMAFAVATDIHRVAGAMLGNLEQISWQGETVAWLLPLFVLALPITLLLDRDVRHSRSSLYTLRMSGLLWYVAAWIELFEHDLPTFLHPALIRQLLPMFASATLFLGLWHHARIVAYVCPDPPELNEPHATSVLWSALKWCLRRLSYSRQPAAADVELEETEKPKRRRKKAEIEADEVAEAPAKRKRKTPAKRAPSKPRSRVKQPELEELGEYEEPLEESAGSADEEPEDDSMSYEDSAEADGATQEEELSEWQDEAADEARNDGEELEQESASQYTEVHEAHSGGVPAPHSHRHGSHRDPEPEYVQESAESSYGYEDSGNSSEEDDEQAPGEFGISADQLKGLSKKQKRELRKQNRDKQRGRG